MMAAPEDANGTSGLRDNAGQKIAGIIKFD
jgi:hypothetical protein